jgi:hypothetical protein
MASLDCLPPSQDAYVVPDHIQRKRDQRRKAQQKLRERLKLGYQPKSNGRRGRPTQEGSYHKRTEDVSGKLRIPGQELNLTRQF